jgi:hypothetical protein
MPVYWVLYSIPRYSTSSMIRCAEQRSAGTVLGQAERQTLVRVKYLNWVGFQFNRESYVRLGVELHDWNALADYLEAGYPLTAKLRTYLVKVLRGKRRPRGQRVTLATIARGTEQAEVLAELERDGIGKAKADRLEIAKMIFDREPRTIERAVEGIEIITQENPAERTSRRLRKRRLTKARSRR